MTYKKLLQNIYYMAYHHKDSNHLLMNDLLRDDVDRAKCKGSYDAYAAIVQMIEMYDSIGKADYKKTFKMTNGLPVFINNEK